MSSGVAIGIEFADAALEASIRAGLQRVEEQLVTAVRADDPFVSEVAEHLVLAGGKRFRPLLALLASHFGDAEAPDVVTAAVVCELTHLATLYHDDVMDEAPLRRGAESANSRWNNTVAILTGDFLFARASDLLADLGPQAVRIQARCFERLVTGQIRETVGPSPGVDPVDHYLGVLAEKTGSLIATSAEFGARFAGVSTDGVAALRTYGEQIGVAFQISDDILDIASDPEVSGKAPGTDLREGVLTLPVLYALRDGGPEADRLHELVGQPLVDPVDHAEALALLRGSKAIALARETTLGYANAARTTLATLPAGPARSALQALADLVVTRSA